MTTEMSVINREPIRSLTFQDFFLRESELVDAYDRIPSAL